MHREFARFYGHVEGDAPKTLARWITDRLDAHHADVRTSSSSVAVPAQC